MQAACRRMALVVAAAAILVLGSGMAVVGGRAGASDKAPVLGAVPSGAPASTWNWTNMDPASAPSARADVVMVYDSGADRIILFGGYLGGGAGAADTWAYDDDTNTWTNMNPASHPSARWGHAMAYDSRADRVILFAGYDGTNFVNDTWAYDYANNTWTNLDPAKSPPVTAMHGLAYDAAADRVILFGGIAANGDSNDTWAYDYGGNSWTDRTPMLSPSPRRSMGMTYDSASQRVVVFGGIDPNWDYFNETWVYSSAANTWSNLTTFIAPPRRYWPSIAYDTAVQRTILFGGYYQGYGTYNDTWAFSLGFRIWGPLSPAASPPARRNFQMAYDSQSDRVVMFGGFGALGEFLNDTWASGGPPSPGPPSAPRDLQAVAGNGSVNLTWSAPSSDGGSPITNYSIYRGTGSGLESLLVTLADVPSFEDDNVSNGVTYYYQVAAINAIGEGPRSQEVSAVPAPALSPPSDPLELGSVAGDGSVALAWRPPVDDGGSTITNYTVYRGDTSGGESYLVTVGNVTAFTDGGLTNGVTYYYQVSAVNAVGEGARSSEVSATPTTTPSEPRNLTAVAEEADILVSWEAPSSDGGSPVTGYRLYRGTASGNETLLVELANILTYTDSGVSSGVTYYYQVRALNGVGEGPPSDEVSATVPTPTAPSMILSLTASAGVHQVTLTWEAPSSDGGSPITNYRIYRGTTTGGESLLTTLGTVLIYTDSGLTSGVEYFYEVTAINAIGEGPRSAEVSATPSGNLAPTASFTVTPSSGDTGTTFTVDASASTDPEDASTALQVRWDWQDDGTWDTSWSSTKTAQHQYATPGMYTIRLEVQDTGGLNTTVAKTVTVTAPPADTTQPTVAVTSPSNGAMVTSATVTVTGTARDNVAVQKVELSLDGTTWILASGTASWSGTLTLAEGANTIYVRVTDTSGNSATTTLSVTVQAPATGPSPQGLDPMTAGLVAAAIGGAVVIVVAQVLIRRRRRGGPGP